METDKWKNAWDLIQEIEKHTGNAHIFSKIWTVLMRKWHNASGNVYPLWQDKILIVLMHQRPDYFTEVDNQQISEINLDSR